MVLVVLEDFLGSPLAFESEAHEVQCQLLEIVSVSLSVEPVHEYSLTFMHPQLREVVYSRD